MINLSELNGLQVLYFLLTSKEGIFLWWIMGIAVLIFFISRWVDKNDEVSKHIDPNDQIH